MQRVERGSVCVRTPPRQPAVDHLDAVAYYPNLSPDEQVAVPAVGAVGVRAGQLDVAPGGGLDVREVVDRGATEQPGVAGAEHVPRLGQRLALGEREAWSGLRRGHEGATE